MDVKSFLSSKIKALLAMPRLSLAYYISFWVFGTVLLSLGPMLQYYLLAVINSSAISIYASVYKEAVTSFPVLSEWLGGMAYLVFSICSLIVVVCSLRAETYRGFFIRVFISSASALTLLDLVADTLHGSISVSGAFTNLVCNIIGGLLVSTIFVLMLRATKAISTATDDHIVAQQSIALVFPPVAGVLLIVFSYYVAGLFFKLVPANVEVLVKPNSRGVAKYERLSADSDSHCGSGCKSITDQGKLFGFFVGAGEVEELVSLGHEKGALSLLWAAGNDDSVYDITISALSGCHGVEHDKLKLVDSKSYKIASAKKMSLELDEGAGLLSLVSPQSHLEVMDSVVTDFSVLKSNVEPKKLALVRSVKSPSGFDYWSASQSYKIVISAELSKTAEDSTVTPKSRVIKIKVDGREYRLLLNSNSLAMLHKKPVCSSLDVSGFENTNVSLLNNLSVSAGVVVRVERRIFDDKVFYAKSSALTVRGANGWLVVDKVAPSLAHDFVRAGTIENLAFGGGVKSFYLNGASVSTADTDWFAISESKLIGSMDKDGNMLYSGVGQNIWKGNGRLNKTRWENIDVSTQIVLLSLLGIGGAALFGFFVGSMRDNKRIEIL